MKSNITVLIAFILSFTSQITSAQTLTDSTQITLKEVEITSTIDQNKTLLNQPASVVKLNPLEIKRGTGLYLDDAINENVPGVLMERRTISAGQQFNIRGYGNGVRGTNGISSNFDGQGYKVYLNGIPVTDAEGITLMDDLDFGSVGNVEVVKGPSGTLYGLAIAGVVNLQTRNAEKGKVSIGQDFMTGSYGLKRLTTHVEIGGEHSSFLVNYGKQQSDGFIVHTASHKDFVNLIGELKPNEKQTIGAYVGFSDSYDERQGELTINQYDSLIYTGNPAYINNNAHSNIISFRAGVSHTYVICKNLSNTSSVFGTSVSNNSSSAAGWTDKDPVNYGFISTMDMKFALNKNFNLTGIVGGEGQVQNAQTIGYAMVVDSSNITGYHIIGSMTSNKFATSKTSSIFTEWALSMPHDFSLTAGLGSSTMSIDLRDRFYVPANNKKITLIPTRYTASYDNMVSPHVALNKVFNKKLSGYIAYSKGYKAPVSSYFFIPSTGALNTGLKSEVGEQIEIGTKGSLLDNKLYYTLAAFQATFSNKMTAVAVPLNSTTTAYTYVANGGKQEDNGIEALVKYTAYRSSTGFFSAVNLFANLTISDFHYRDFTIQSLDATKKNVLVVDYSDKTVAGVPRNVANAGIDLTTKPGIYANVTYSYRDGMYFTSDGLNKTDRYILVNSKLGFRRTFLKHYDIDIYGGAVNMTNTQYAYMVFLNQLPDAYMPAPNKINYYGGLNLKYIF